MSQFLARLSPVTTALALLLLASCKIQVQSTPAGEVLSTSGDYRCKSGQTCIIDVQDTLFKQTFRAEPAEGFFFRHWLAKDGTVCGNDSKPCKISSAGAAGNQILLDIISSDQVYQLQPVFGAKQHHTVKLVSAGDIQFAEIYNNIDAGSDHLSDRWTHDLDGDGDEDIVVTSSTLASQPRKGGGQGAILINKGDYSFSLAGGDRPNTETAREVLFADFNGDGMTDIFIADTGWDTDPFPGFPNQLLLQSKSGFKDVSKRLPKDDTGFTHNAALGDIDYDGDVDILVANHGGKDRKLPYILLNDGSARFSKNTDRLPSVMQSNGGLPWVTELADLDEDGYLDLVTGGWSGIGGKSTIYWGSAKGRYDAATSSKLPAPDYYQAMGGFDLSNCKIVDLDGDGRLDLLFSGYRPAPHFSGRGLQAFINKGKRKFADETTARFGKSAADINGDWSLNYRFFDLNRDGTEDIVRELYPPRTDDVLAWLNDGSGYYAPLRTSEFSDEKALFAFANGTFVGIEGEYRAIQTYGDGAYIGTNLSLVSENPKVRPR